MARVQFINAIVSGKVGGAVYAHNKAGSYLRINRPPTNPKSMGQVMARAGFSGGPNLWRACTAAQKAAYNTFAASLFNPLKARVGVLYTGNQAANALNTATISSTLLIRATTVKISTVTATCTFGTFIGNPAPPSYRLAGLISSSTAAPISLALSDATLATSGAVTFKLTANALIAAAPIFQNVGQTEKVGFSMYMSNPITGGQSFVTNKYHTFLGSTGTILTNTVTIVTPGNLIEFGMAGTEFKPQNFKKWVTIGNKVRLTCIMQSTSGQLTDLGSFDFTIVA